MAFGDFFRGVGNVIGQTAKGVGNVVGAAGGGLNKLFSGFGQGASQGFNKIAPNPSGAGAPMIQPKGGMRYQDLVKDPSVMGGLGTMFGSQLIKNPKAPKLPASFDEFQAQANAGGTPGMQAANKYYQGVLSGENGDAYEAATHSLDQNYQEQLRGLNSMYKSLRPGTDPTTDTTYQRDLNNLNDLYARQKAQVRAQVQQGAAAGSAQVGAEQASQQMAGVETQVNQIAQQWGMDYAQKQALRDMLMQMGGNVSTLGVMSKLFPSAFTGTR